MNINANQITQTVKQVIAIVGLACAAVAVLKVMGVQVPIRASVTDLCLLAAACGLNR